jgi:hypothetical protein
MTKTIDNSKDVIDSRDIIARIEELEAERDAFEPAELAVADMADPALAVADRPAATWAEEYPEDAAELAALLALQEEAEGYAPDWRHGATLIRDTYFVVYAQEFADDIGAIKSDASWPATCIDWDEAARQLQRDYTSVDFDGEGYWI